MTEIFLNPGFENWTAGAPDDWAVTVEGACTITQETDFFHGGASSLKIVTDGVPSSCQILQAVALVQSQKYTLSIWRNHVEVGKSLKVMIRDDTATVWLEETVDGEFLWTDVGPAWITIPNTEDFDQFILGFHAHNDYTDYEIIFARGDDATSTTIYLDDASLALSDEEDTINAKTTIPSDTVAPTEPGTLIVIPGGPDIVFDDADQVAGWDAAARYITFDHGGTHVPIPGDTIMGNTSGRTGTCVAIITTSGTWAGGNAAGYCWLKALSGDGLYIPFETVSYPGTIDGFRVLTNYGSSTVDPSLALDTVDMAEGTGSIKVTTGSEGNALLITCVKDVVDFSGLQKLFSYTKEYLSMHTMGFGEETIEQIKTNIPATGDWYNKEWDISAIADADKDAVTQMAWYFTGTSYAAGLVFRVDRSYSPSIVPASLWANLEGETVQVYPTTDADTVDTKHAADFVPAGLPRFAANKGGVDQGGVVTATETKVTFGTEEYDIGSKFASSTWTPGKLGAVHITAKLTLTVPIDTAGLRIMIYKNGAEVRRSSITFNGTGIQQGSMLASDLIVDNVADYFEIYAHHTCGSNKIINGGTFQTWFTGHFLA
jgi:hypothetical protein